MTRRAYLSAALPLLARLAAVPRIAPGRRVRLLGHGPLNGVEGQLIDWSRDSVRLLVTFPDGRKMRVGWKAPDIWLVLL